VKIGGRRDCGVGGVGAGAAYTTMAGDGGGEGQQIPD
jgi:hypothetical protein